MKLVISLYDFTGLMVEKFRQAGIVCLLVDGKHAEGTHSDPERPGLYKLGAWLERDFVTMATIARAVKALCRDYGTNDPQVVAVFGFPPCDDLASSGARWFEKKLAEDPECQHRAAERAKFVEDVAEWFNSAPWFAENPRGVLSTLWRRYDFVFSPWEFGAYLPADDVHPTYPEYIAPRDKYTKETWLWWGNGFPVPMKRPVIVPVGYSKQYNKLGGKTEKTKTIRSATPRGFAAAVFEAFKRQELI